ncbi:MAG TPA: hypothetical protein VI141_09480 [Acidimicrobiia bacterium]|jgi:hypothetical protein
MTEPERPQRNPGALVGVGAVLGVGIGAAVGTAIDDLSTGIWIGAVIGVGLGLLASYFAR